MMEDNDNSRESRIFWFIFAVLMIMMALLPLFIVSEEANKNNGTDDKTIIQLMFHKK